MSKLKLYFWFCRLFPALTSAAWSATSEPEVEPQLLVLLLLLLELPLVAMLQVTVMKA